MKQLIAIASDHAGFELKEKLKEEIAVLGFQAHDLGTKDTQSVDYPDYALRLVEWMKKNADLISPSPLVGEGRGGGVSSKEDFYLKDPLPLTSSHKGRGDKKVFGVLICGSGIGMSIAANRHKGIRAALVHDGAEAALARKHNNANVLCLGARTTDEKNAKDALKVFLETPFEGGRHEKRVNKLDA